MNLILDIFPYAIAYTMPLLAAALGGLYSERSGVVNIGLEGLMVMGMFVSAITIAAFEPAIAVWTLARCQARGIDIVASPAEYQAIFNHFHAMVLWIGVLAGTLGATIFSLLHAFASVTLKANQVISGTAINMIAGAITVFLARTISGSGNISIKLGFLRGDVPVLSKIPLLGRLFFSQTYATTWLVLLILVVSWLLIYRTPFGLRLRSCGEHPQTADAAGINVYRVRYIAVMLSGAMAGLAGSVMLVTYAGEFTGSVAGMGFLALAALIFGQWKPLGILGATFFFGIAATIANVAPGIPRLSSIPEWILRIFPYVVTLVALMLFSKTSQAPRASGEAFDKGKR
ncbi:MAG: sugar ABC transporter permease [Spirochaetes bacterium GWD1_61_31]|nr:MAG: sugar ABC transporter permease [Spirochaetes bacterium GWB1_60_80]OHD29076.1 MAG: sugar ABC transporter permease [Spirochaetes bacterium GWC1_61_12]OHD43107.1 MAG: sugar ABC transporter permease [Spirochaetes bacterium GWD1_61_31]OHD44241.1 MAG: sugar ABC transporter permease [Spirochaetes bacterium GWE1_60_18]OHD60399.1 MAG: sugar ABC transporter permease [Spirochaetes bacterium GWF1_60_12]HAP43285.1 sugar ABC transporter permease [Spirochaetaceae bacterium]